MSIRNCMTKLRSVGFVTEMPITSAEMASAFVDHPGYPAERAAEERSASDWAFLKSRLLVAPFMMLVMLGMAIAARMAITAITTNNSTKENPEASVFILSWVCIPQSDIGAEEVTIILRRRALRSLRRWSVGGR